MHARARRKLSATNKARKWSDVAWIVADTLITHHRRSYAQASSSSSITSSPLPATGVTSWRLRFLHHIALLNRQIITTNTAFLSLFPSFHHEDAVISVRCHCFFGNAVFPYCGCLSTKQENIEKLQQQSQRVFVEYDGVVLQWKEKGFQARKSIEICGGVFRSQTEIFLQEWGMCIMSVDCRRTTYETLCG